MKTNIRFRVESPEVLGSTDNKDKLKVVIFVSAYLSSYKENESSFVGYANNFTGIDLTQKWAGSSNYFDTKYYCGSNSQTTLPYAQFKNVTSNIEMLAKLWDQRMSTLDLNPESVTNFWISNRKAVNLKGTNLQNEIEQLKKSGEYDQILSKVDAAIKLYNRSGG